MMLTGFGSLVIECLHGVRQNWCVGGLRDVSLLPRVPMLSEHSRFSDSFNARSLLK
jgi:hypothetical protein